MEHCPICEKEQDGFASVQVDENDDGSANYGLLCEHCHSVFTQYEVDSYYKYLELSGGETPDDEEQQSFYS